MHIGVDYAVATDLRFVTYISVRRIDKGYSCFGHQASDRVTPQKIFELSQFGPGVDAQHFTRILMLIDRDHLAIVAHNAGDISQIVLTLTVGWLHSLQCGAEFSAVKAIDAGIDFANLPLFVGGVPLLDNFREAVIVVAHDASITGRILESDGQHRAGSLVHAMLRNQRAQGCRAHQRNITRKNQDRGVRFAQLVPRRHHRVAGAALFRLSNWDGLPGAEFLFHRRLNLAGLMANYHINPARIQGGGSPRNMRDQRPPTQLVQDLCHARFHPRAKAGGENKDIERHFPVALIQPCGHWVFSCFSVINQDSTASGTGKDAFSPQPITARARRSES